MSELRKPENMFESDMVGKYLMLANEDKYVTIDDFYRMIEKVKLNNKPPSEIQEHFDNARNLFLYSFYNYRFGMTAQKEAITTLEFALKDKAIANKIDIEKRQGLQKLNDLAIKEGWIKKEDLPSIREDITTIEKYKEFIGYLQMLRNELSHGSSMIYPPSTSEFYYVRNIINILYR